MTARKAALYVALLGALWAASAGHVVGQKAVFANPVVAGDYPDPSVIRVGSDFYATATSSEWAPEFPLLHSRDLVNWEIVGNIFPQRPAWSVGNYWAPEIWQENGKFYVFYVARKKDGPLCIAAATAEKPLGPYTDHGPLECQEVGSIDAFPIRDENGKLFVVWKEDGNSVGKPTPLWAQELDTTKWQLVGTRHELFRNDPQTWEGTLIEGPYVIRRNGYFYLFYAANYCCGRGCNYAAGVARSATLLGQWEKYAGNPILKGNENWNCPGHGSIVTAADGRTYFIYHAYHRKDTNYVGRQALLDEVTWTADGWAAINQGQGPSRNARSPLGAKMKRAEYQFFDDFTAPTLRTGWQWQQNNVPQYRLSDGFLELAPNTAQSANLLGGIMAWWTTTGDYTATTMLEPARVTKGALAGLAAYGDDENALGFGWQDGQIVVWRRERKQHRMLATVPAPAGSQLYLRLTARDGIFYSFATSTDGRNFKNVGYEQNGDYLPPWDRGIRVALTVGGANNATARFGSLRIMPTR